MLSRSKGTTYYTAIVLITSIVEINVGIVVGCMPVIQIAMLRKLSKFLRLPSFRSFVSRISTRQKSSTSGANGGQEPKGHVHGAPYLETRIINGADGRGNFIRNTSKSGVRGWWWGTNRGTTERTWGSSQATNMDSTVSATTITVNDSRKSQEMQSLSPNKITVTRGFGHGSQRD